MKLKLTAFITAIALMLFGTLTADAAVYTVEGMHCGHCEAAVRRAVEDIPGVESARASASRNTSSPSDSFTFFYM